MLAICALLLFGWLAGEVAEGGTAHFDSSIRAGVHRLASLRLTAIMLFFTTVGSPLVVWPLATALFVVFRRMRRRRAALLLVIVMAGAAILMEGLKLAFQRPRPEPFFGLPAPASYSFPSGHALFAMSFYGILASLAAGRSAGKWPRVLIWTFAAVLIAAIGFSRVYLGVHYATDVVAGYAVGFAWVEGVCFWRRLGRLRTGGH